MQSLEAGESFRVASVQAAPEYLDIDATVEKVVALVGEAASHGARLIGFPESFVPGFPLWVFKTAPLGPASRLFHRLYKNAVVANSNHVAAIGEAARSGNIYVSVSVTERDGGSLYLSQLWFDPSGRLIGKHRKLKPTAAERYIWGEGDPSTLAIYETPLGRLGGLQCWENLIPAIVNTMANLNEQIHVAAWPYAAFNDGGLYEPIKASRRARLEGKNPDDEGGLSPREIITRNYALATQSFVVMPTTVMTQGTIDVLVEEVPSLAADIKLGGGASRIIAPDGVSIGNHIPDTLEGIVYGDIALDELIYAKYLCDPGGHYRIKGLS
jgi:predicted amidohydrolase